MNKFTYSYPTKVYFGGGVAADALGQELPRVGKTAMLAYGGGSVKRSGVYDELKGLLAAAGKEVVDFPGIMPNPTYAKVQEGAKLARERQVDFILAVGSCSPRWRSLQTSFGKWRKPATSSSAIPVN